MPIGSVVNPSVGSVISSVFGGGSSGGSDSSTVTQSIDYNGSNQFLSMSNANWGSYNRSKFAIAGSFYRDSGGGVIMSRSGASADREFALDINVYSTDVLTLRDPSGAWRITSTPTYATGAWFAFLVHYDSAQATEANRLRMWVNGVEPATTGTRPTLNAAVNTGASNTKIATWDTGAANINFLNGRIFSLAFFSDTLPTAEQIFDGTDGKVKDFKALTGLYSLLDVDGGDVTSDFVLASNWTNNNTSTASSDIP